MPLIIYGLGGVHTHTHAHIHSRIESDFKKPGARRPAPSLKILLPFYSLFVPTENGTVIFLI